MHCFHYWHRARLPATVIATWRKVTVSCPIAPSLTKLPWTTTLNIAHGRNQAANQLLLGKQDIEKNLKTIAQVLRESGADVIALQEADGPSRWSGNFDHIEYLARAGGYPWHYSAAHARSWLFSYGTAILSRLPVDETIGHTFTPSPPTFNKGFILSRVIWNENGLEHSGIPIDIVSVHLDFSRHRVRERQIAELSEILGEREGPMIVLGDFNSEWLTDGSVVRKLADTSGLSVYRYDADDLDTYRARHRFDWILVSEELTFVSYRVLPGIVSDHRAVMAEISLKNAKASPSVQTD